MRKGDKWACQSRLVSSCKKMWRDGVGIVEDEYLKPKFVPQKSEYGAGKAREHYTF